MAAFFVTPTGWGRLSYHLGEDGLKLEFRVDWGELQLKTLIVDPGSAEKRYAVGTVLGDDALPPPRITPMKRGIELEFRAEVGVKRGDMLGIQITVDS